MKRITLLFAITFVFYGCVSVDIEQQNFQDISNLSSEHWTIGFDYEFSDDTTTEEDEIINTHIKALDDIYYNLLENNLNITKSTSNDKSNFIGCNFVYSGYFTHADINFYDLEGNIITRIKIDNQYRGGLSYPLKINEFTRYCSDLILETLE